MARDQDPKHTAVQHQGTQKSRRLVVLMFSDMVGYSYLSATDERLAVELLEEHRKIVRSALPLYGGVENKTIGDAFFIEFGSAVQGLDCAREIQVRLYERNLLAPSTHQISLRIGLHLGDVVEFENDRFGDGVNIASRVENQAEAGGVFLTRQVYDQVRSVQGLEMKRVGFLDLKNIPEPVEVFKVTPTWIESQRKKRSLLSWERFREIKPMSWGVIVLTSLFFVAASLLVTQVVRYQPTQNLGSTQHLPEAWEYAIESGDSSTWVWKPFDYQKRYAYAREIQGPYRMRVQFRLERAYQSPAILAGYLPVGASLYVNDLFVGGGGAFAHLEVFYLDQKILQVGKINTVMLKAPAPGESFVGLGRESSLPALIGEARQITAFTEFWDLTFFVSRALYMCVNLALGLIFLAQFKANKKRRDFLYGGLYLLSTSAYLLYYNMLVSGPMPEITRQFIKTASLWGGIIALLLTISFNTKKKRLEGLTAAIGSLGWIALFVWLWPTAQNYLQIIEKQTYLLHGIMFLSSLGFGLAFSHWLSRIRSRRSRSASRLDLIKGLSQTKAELALVALFGLQLGFAWVGLRREFSPLAQIFPRHWDNLRDLLHLFQACLALSGAAYAVYSYFVTQAELKHRRKAEDLLLKCVRVIQSHQPIGQRIGTLQKLFAEAVEAERSTLYVVDPQAQEARVLKTHWVLSNTRQTQLPESRIEVKSGLLSYVWDHHAPLLIADIRSDLRFSDYIRSRTDVSRYSTGACMVFPLVQGGALKGVLTIADPKGRKEFSSADFKMAQKISLSLALLLEKFQEEELSSQETSSLLLAS